ncbi:acyltransferase family protein [Mycobacterium camsae]|uniref:acyltransferase family protein n=1 Tax=Mycobacterium gordonae TaxID=1778 RepID=UPI00197CFBC1|nr:acyltransferase family protein [Mycobacterium gordonae]
MTQADLPKPPFRPDIEGLRAVAVIAVVLYHTGIPGIGGGYIGVDVFFVISGFLITGLLLREVQSSKTVALGRFYAARARRLLPAAATVGIVTAVAAAAVLPPLQARRVFIDGIASMFYVGNYRFAAQNTDYMIADLPPSPFQHYWSLGVEEQFYLVWPALIIGTAWLARRVTRGDTTHTLPYAVVVAVVGAASLAAAMIWTHTSPPWAFFSLPTRAWELAAGGLVALTITQWKRLPLLPATVAGWGGLTLILLTCTQLGPHTPYPGTSALLPVLGTALVIGAGCVTGGMGVGRVLCPPAMRAIGRVSYSWYLWHWPVLLLLPPLLGDPGGLPGRLAATTVSAGLAVITMHAVENPGRFAAALRRSAKASLAVAGAASAVAACACAVLLTAVPAPVGHGAAAPQAKIVALPPAPDPHLSPQEAAVRQAFTQAREMLAAAASQRAVPSNLNPPLAAAPADKAAVFVNGCMRSWRDVGQSECASVKGDSKEDGATASTVALIGDSHAAMWDPALQQVAEQRHWRLETMAKVTCPFLDIPIVSPYLGRHYTECEQWRGEIVGRLAAERPRLVILSMSRRYHADFSFASYDPAWIDALATVVAQLRGMGSKVLVLGPVADPQSSAPTCLSAHLDDAGACAPKRSVAVNADGVGAEERVTTAAGGSYADLTDLFCDPQRCPLVVGDTLVFRDDNHITTEYARLLSPVVGALADRAITNE